MRKALGFSKPAESDVQQHPRALGVRQRQELQHKGSSKELLSLEHPPKGRYLMLDESGVVLEANKHNTHISTTQDDLETGLGA